MGLAIDRARSFICEATSIHAVITIASSAGVQLKRIFWRSRRMDSSMSSIAISQMSSACDRHVVKKPSLRNSRRSLTSTISATSSFASSNITSRAPSAPLFGWRTPFAFGAKSATSAGGATSVVTSVIMMPMPKISCVRYPAERPMPAMIRATSPRGTMPAPIRRPPSTLKPQPSAGTMQPMTFAAMASAV